MWIELKIKTSADYANTLGDQLSLLGALAVTFQDGGDQPIYEPIAGEPQFWDDTVVVGLFEEGIELPPILTYLENQQAAGLIKTTETQSLAQQDWQRLCLKHFQPKRYGKRLWVCPSWHTPPEPNDVNVLLDPGLAFGTGTHPTTQLCLEWLENNIQPHSNVIDYGCGSGILSLAALKLGASHVLAIDNDPQALQATEQNGQLNDFGAEKLEISLPIELKKQSADLIIANILAAPLKSLVNKFAEALKPNHPIVLSGILLEQVTDICESYAPWFKLELFASNQEWACLTGMRLSEE